MSSVDATAQQNNFNPSWMRSTFHGSGGGGGPISSPRASSEGEIDYPLSDPILVQNRYGREDLLALVGRDSQPPDGLEALGQFLVPIAQKPIVCTPLNDTEIRLQQNINSSKAMSQLSQAERATIAAGGVYTGPGSGGHASSSPASGGGPPASRGGGGGGGGGSGAASNNHNNANNNNGGWSTVPTSKPWNRDRGNSSFGTRGGADTRGGRGGGTFGLNRRTNDGTPDSPDAPSGYTPRFGGMARNGRGGPPSGRGGSTALTYNARAQGLYDPHDPKDRPGRMRQRSTSDEGDLVGGGGAGAPGPRNGWGRGGAWKPPAGSNNDGRLPEWYDDAEERAASEDRSTRAGSGGFDDEGAYRRQQQRPQASTTPPKKTSDDRRLPTPPKNPWAATDQSAAPAANAAPRRPPPAESSESSESTTRASTSVPSTTTSEFKSARSSSGAADTTLSAEQEARIRAESDDAAAAALLMQRNAYAAQAAAAQAQAQQQQQQHSLVLQRILAQKQTAAAIVAKGPPVRPEPPEFYYLDPNTKEQGPFKRAQMDAWHKGGYFMPELRVRRDIDNGYTTLGDLLRVNGRDTPFNFTLDEERQMAEWQEAVKVHAAAARQLESLETVTPASILSSTAGYAGVWGPDTLAAGIPHVSSASFTAPPTAAELAEQADIERKRKALEEEERRIREYKDGLAREAMEREREIQKRELEVKRNQEVLDAEKRRLEENVQEMTRRFEQERKALEEKRAEEERRKKQQEEEARREREKREKEEKRRAAEKEAERLRLEEGRQAEARAEEEAKRLRAAAEFAANKLREDQQRRTEQEAIEARAEAARAREVAERAERERAEREKERLRKEKEKTFVVEEQFEAVKKSSAKTAASQDAGGSRSMSYSMASPPSSASAQPKPAPWSAASSGPREKTLKEIQQEEERQIRAEQAERERLRREDANNLAALGTSWSQKIKTGSGSGGGGSTSSSVWGSVPQSSNTNSRSMWANEPSLESANRPKTSPPVVIKKSAQASIKTPAPAPAAPRKTVYMDREQESIKKIFDTSSVNRQVSDWFVRRVKELNPEIDAEVLVGFIEAVESPDEVEDYLVGYLGESKAVKEIVAQYLQKRSETRSKKANAGKDDLSSAFQVSGTSGAPSGSAAAAKAAPMTAAKKKKGKAGQKLLVDGACLGFRATADSNRTNVGEIETVAPAPPTRR